MRFIVGVHQSRSGSMLSVRFSSKSPGCCALAPVPHLAQAGHLRSPAGGARDGGAMLTLEVGEDFGARPHEVEVLLERGGLAVGRSPGQAWLRSRFSGPYLRDDLLTQGDEGFQHPQTDRS